jgi:hypothetical protein
MKVDFSMLNEYERCPRRYFWRYEEQKIKIGAQAPLLFGTAIHLAMDSWYMDKNIEKAIQLFKDNYPQNLDEKRTVECGEVLIREYAKTYANQPFEEIIATEKQYEMPLTDELVFVGKLDKIIKWVYGLTAIDHKTTSLYLSTYVPVAETSWQYTGYDALLKNHYSTAWGVLVDILHVPAHLWDKEKKPRTAFERVLLTKSPFETAQWQEWVQDVANLISENRKVKKWRKNMGECYSYNSQCSYLDFCLLPVPFSEQIQLMNENPMYETAEWKL